MRPAFLRLQGAVIGRLAVVGKAKIGGRLSNLIIGSEASLGRCEIALHDKVTIGKNAVINDGAILLTASHSLTDPQWGQKKAPIFIGDFAWIATNALVLPGVKIGTGAVVGAGSVVRSDVPDYAVVAGNPATQLEIRRIDSLCYSPVMLNAPFEAWVGPEFEREKSGGVA
ncbi:acyltransferase [Pseudomonas sp. N040]|nr:acyltransferase [Pseudomonas sp. N040]MBW7014149.1 acyltransferase [Pseudomonas sp. N040]